MSKTFLKVLLWMLMIGMLVFTGMRFGREIQAQVIPSARRIAAPTAVASGSSSLNTSLISYWKLGEASGTRVDSEPTGTAQNLTDNNTVTSATGIIGNAALFTASNNEYLNRADSADLSTGDIDFTVAAWVWLNSTNAIRRLITKGAFTGSTREWGIIYNNGSDRFLGYISSDGAGGSPSVTATSAGSPGLSVWHLIVFSHDSVNNLIKISIDNGTVDTATTGASVPNDRAGTFSIGEDAGAYWDGRVDEVPFWKKVISASEITELYSAGAGKTCCPF